MRPHNRLIFVLAGTMLWPAAALAIVNVDQAMVDDSGQGARHSAHLALDGAQGNTNKQSLRGDWLSRLRRGGRTWFFYLEYAHGKSNGRTDTNRLFVHLRHRAPMAGLWSWEIFTQYGRDPFARLSLRMLAGGGLRRALTAPDATTTAWAGLGMFHEWERLSHQAGATDRRTSQPRLSSYLVMRHQFNPQVGLDAIAYYQPAPRDMADYRMLAQSALNIRMNNHLRWQIRLEYSFDARPPQMVKSTDVRYSAGLSLRF